MGNINDRTSVPLSWVAVATAAILGPVIAGSMWVKGVNDRLGRIETYLHIQVENSAVVTGFGITPAEAKDARK